MIKTCTKCKVSKPVVEFNKHLTTKDGLNHVCRGCVSKIKKSEWSKLKEDSVKYKQHKIKRHNYSKQYRATNAERISTKRNSPEARKGQAYRVRSRYRKRGWYVYQHLIRKAKDRGLEYLDKDSFIRWYDQQERFCYYCGIPENLLSMVDYMPKAFTKTLTIDRKDSMKGYIQDNMVLACGACNVIKSSILTHIEMSVIGLQYLKPRWVHINAGGGVL